MIRRPRTEADGSQRWVLISQVDHARLAGELAGAWGAAPFSRLEPYDELVAAIHRHDDGWADWERRPDVDAQTGQPLDFTEMPQDDSLAIWRGSIQVAAGLGCLAAYVVSGHFSALLRRALEARADAETAWTDLAIGFLDEQDTARSQWLAGWLAGGKDCTPAMAERALAWLQWFDGLSLWICCRERTEPLETASPEGPAVRFSPVTPARIAVEPWPFVQSDLILSTAARSVPVARYRDQAALAAAPAEAVTLEWTLAPSLHG
jgi:hypothetical protein